MQQILLEHRAPVRGDEDKAQRDAAGEIDYGGDQAGEVLTNSQHFAAHGRQKVIMQRALEHFGAKQVRKDAETSEKNAEAQKVDLEDAGEDHVVVAHGMVAAAEHG